MKSVLAFVASTCLITACASIEEHSIPLTKKDFQHHNWELTHIDGKAISYPDKTEKPRLEVGEHFTANGIAGCNYFSGQAELTANGEFRIATMAMTKKMCSPSEMNVEQVMAKTLSSWSKVTLNSKSMTLKGEEHTLTLKLRDWMN